MKSLPMANRYLAPPRSERLGVTTLLTGTRKRKDLASSGVGFVGLKDFETIYGHRMIQYGMVTVQRFR